jgi:UDP-N-acetylglucosamine pyrophosphorylase
MTNDIWSVKSFEDLSPEELQLFNALVLKDIKEESTEEEFNILLNNIELWMFQLRIIRKDVEFQLASQKAKDKIKVYDTQSSQEELNDYFIKQNKWRMGAVRFLTAIEHKMLYVKMIITEESHRKILEQEI